MNWPVGLALIFHWYLSLFCQTFFLHRYAAHGMFKLPKLIDRLFYLMTFIAQGPSFLNPRAYALLHQAHHKFSDTKDDPHSPHFYPSLKKMMVKTFHDYHSLVKNPRGMRHDFYYPTWPTLDRFAGTWLHTMLWLALYIYLYGFLASARWHYLFVAVHCMMGPIQGALVNWYGHKLGYRNYALPDQSKNTLPIDLLLMGELYQNNHHRFPMEMNFARRWFEWDPTYSVIFVMKKLRLLRFHLRSEFSPGDATAPDDATI